MRIPTSRSRSRPAHNQLDIRYLNEDYQSKRVVAGITLSADGADLVNSEITLWSGAEYDALGTPTVYSQSDIDARIKLLLSL